MCVHAIMIGKFRFAVAFKNLVHAADTAVTGPAPRSRKYLARGEATAEAKAKAAAATTAHLHNKTACGGAIK